MVMAVFMAMIAIGALYYLVGLGNALVAQERMQDAADAAAFSSAVIHARGMNVLALINIMLASLMAVVMLLTMLTSLFGWGTKLATAMCPVPIVGLVACALITPTKLAHSGFLAAKNVAKPMSKAASKVLVTMQEPIRRLIPAVGALNAESLVSTHYGPVVKNGFTFPLLNGLPTTKGSFDDLCDKAGEYVGSMLKFPVTKAFSIIKPKNRFTDWLREKMESGLEKAASAYARYYCGKGPPPDAMSSKVKVAVPGLQTKEKKACDDSQDVDACRAVASQEKDLLASYSVEEGKCSSSHKGSKLCNKIRTKARIQCNPKTAGKKISGYRWIERRYSRNFEVVGKKKDRKVVELPVTNDKYLSIDKEVSYLDHGPCQSAMFGIPTMSTPGTGLTKWNSKPKGPVCETEFKKPSLLYMDTLGIKEFSQDLLEITDVLRCTQKKTVKADFEKSQASEDEKEWRKPQELCSCAELGEKEFQIKAVVQGDAKAYTKQADKFILVATQGQEVNSAGAIEETIGKAGKIAVAQAEYYYAGSETERSEWLWHLGWKARMRRFKMKPKEYECPRKDTCSDRGGGTKKKVVDTLLDTVGGVDSIITH